jgi:site-specific DNA-cytosine methylase
MAESAQQGGKLNVFISYSRDDLDFADQLRAALLGYDFTVTIDREIPSGEDWKKRLGLLIRDADTIVFVLSPSSARSSTCAWEATEAASLGKRILPILCRSLGDASPPPELAALQFTYFYDERKFPGSGFGTGLNNLRLSLNVDPGWLREHTHYLRLAKEWEEVGKPSDRRLLSAADIELAKTWISERPEKASPPTALQLDFIKASEAEDIRRQSAEAQRVREIAEAQAAREAALVDREEAQKGEAEAQKREAEEARRVAQRTRVGAGVAVVLAVVAGWFALNAHRAEQTANLERESAVKATQRADSAREETQRQLNRANQALAESINNDLGFKPDEPLTPRQRQALWKLAVADELVKRDFESILASSPDETIRVSPGFAYISRALGLLKASQARDLVVRQVGQTTNPEALQALAQALQALPAGLTETQASQVIDLVLKQIGQTTDPKALRALAKALQALPAKPTDAQASQAIEPVLERIGQTTEPGALQALSEALQALPTKLTDAQAAKAIDPVLKQIGQTTDPKALQALAKAVQALAEKLTEAQASQVLESLLKQIGPTTDPQALLALAKALHALPAKLTNAQASRATEPVLKQIGQTTDPKALQALAEALQTSPTKLTDAQAAKAIDPVLKQIVKTTDPKALQALAKAVQALAEKLTEAQASQAIKALRRQIGQTTDPGALMAQAQPLMTLAAKSPNDQLTKMLEQISESIKALAAKNANSGDADQMMMMMMLMSGDSQASYALPVKPTEAQGGRTTTQADRPDNRSRDASEKNAGTLPARLTDAQVGQAIEPLLKQIGQAANPEALRTLAQALQALAGKMTEAQAAQASEAAAASLAWAAADGESAEWARALVALAHPPSDRDRMLAVAIAYPTAAGSATQVLLDAIRAGHPDAPKKEAGTDAALAWVTKTYPEVLRPPVCPQPLQQQAGLKCPPSASQ